MSESEFGVSERATSQAAHHDSRSWANVTGTEISYLLDIAQPNATSTQVAEMLNNKCSRAAIRHWRTGRKRPPQWVLDTIYSIAIARVQRLTGSIEPSIARDILGTRKLKAFMARRARERDAKKKAGD